MDSIFFLVIISFVVLFGCTPPGGVTPPAASTTTSAPTSPAPPPSVLSAACTNLAKLGCPEGKDPKCVEVLGRLQGVSPIKPDCLAGASSPTVARACGGVSCTIP